MADMAKIILDKYQVRKSAKEKEHFRNWLTETLQQAGYAPKVEKGRTCGVCCHNVVVGDPERAKVLLTAHYDTCAVLPFPNLITPRSLFWYVVYQLVVLVGVMVLLTVVSFLLHALALSDWAHMLFIDGLLIFLLWWMVAGPANRHTANDNTSGVVTILETALSLPEELRERVCFVFFDNEEKGLLGSAAFAKAHKAVRKSTPVLNFDCVGDGDSLQFFPTKKMRREQEWLLEAVEESYPHRGAKAVEVVRSFALYPSDQANFTYGVGICALRKAKLFGYYMNRIHTKHDTVLEIENVELLRDGTVALLQTLQEKEEVHAG